VVGVKVLESNNRKVDYYVLAAVRNWRYKPATYSRQPLVYRLVVPVTLEPK
jgi:outer membrane biosynthesis protein TonB